MKLPQPEITVIQNGVTTVGATGIVLMILHMLGHLTGWAWPILYVFLILAGIGREHRKVKQ